MASLRKKLIIISLVLYWLSLFLLAHIPIPPVVYKAQVSDKGLHFVAYLVLVFLLWFAACGDRKVSWRKSGPWWVLLVVLCYGGIDELLQPYTGRTCDATDFAANFAGAITGLALLTFLAFWPALLSVTAIAVFTITNLARANVAELAPRASAAFYLTGYGLFTGLWLRYIRLRFALRPPQIRWALAAAALPAAFLLAAKLFSIAYGRNFSARNVILCAAAIAAVVAAVLLAALFRRIVLPRFCGSALERRV